jgi:hypothetical protein
MRVFVTTETTKTEDTDAFDVSGDVSKIDTTVTPASATEVIANDVLDEWNPREPIGRSLASKLRRGGRISFVGNDLEEISRAMFNRSINLDEANSLLYGQGKKSMATMEQMLQMVDSFGLKVITARVQAFQYYIVAVRE